MVKQVTGSGDITIPHHNSIKIEKADGCLVGTDGIFSSPNVTEPKSNVNRTITTPSVFSDGRGSIHNCLVGGKRINLLHTKAGVMRSGDIHRNVQHDFIFSGKVEVWTLGKDGITHKEVYQQHAFVKIAPSVPHVFHFLEDTVMAEWWEPGTFRAWFYTPYRKIVDMPFEALQNSVKPKMIVYKEADSTSSELDYDKSNSKASQEYRYNMLAWTMVGVIGFVVGIGVGRRTK